MARERAGRLRLRGLPLAWTSEITEWEPPERFQDVQRRGPYAEWVHTHEFEEQDAGTLVRDTVRCRLRGPRVLSRLVNRLLVAPDTARIFRFRHFALEEAFGVRGPGHALARCSSRRRDDPPLPPGRVCRPRRRAPIIRR